MRKHNIQWLALIGTLLMLWGCGSEQTPPGAAAEPESGLSATIADLTPPTEAQTPVETLCPVPTEPESTVGKDDQPEQTIPAATEPSDQDKEDTATESGAAPGATETPGEKTFSVSFLDHDGTILAVQQVAPGMDASLPEDPVRSGYVFAGWKGSWQDVRCDTAVTAQYAGAAAPNLFVAESALQSDGTVKVTVRLTGTIETCGIECSLDYDENVLQYAGMKNHNGTVANNITLQGNKQVLMVWADAVNITGDTIKDEGVLLEITFRVLDGDCTDTVLSFVESTIIVDIVDAQGNYDAAEYTLTKGMVHLK